MIDGHQGHQADHGIIEVFTNRSVGIRDEYDRRLASASAWVDVLGFGLRSFREDYKDALAELGSRTRVRLLLLHPEFPEGASMADLRDKEELNAAGSIRQDIREFLIQVVPVAQSPDVSIQIRLYKAIPSINLFRIDDEMFWGPYLLETQSRNCPTLLLRRPSPLFDRFELHFEKMWSPEWSVTPEEAGFA
jgi:hypothetical protein